MQLSYRKNTFTQHFRGGSERQEGHGHHHGNGDSHAHATAAEGLSDCAVVISHGMGRRAWEDLRAAGIEMIVTDETDSEKAVQLYLAGKLDDRVDKLHDR